MKRKILVRFDDICPTMDFHQFRIAMELMDKYKVKPLIGVIPDCKDSDLMIKPEHSDFWNFVKGLQDKGYAVAMHGVNHVFDSPHKGVVNNRVGSEFAGHTWEEQMRKIREGKNIMENHDIHTDVFFAPAHSYDWNTLKALSACGFKYISDGKSAKPYMIGKVKTLPCRASGCPKIGKSGYYTAVFHAHEWNREDKKRDFISFEKLLKRYHTDIISFDEYKEQPIGNTLTQKIDERLYLIWQYGIKPYLSKLYHLFR